MAESGIDSSIGPLSTIGGGLGALIGLISGAKGKRLSRALKGGGIGALTGAGAGAALDTVPTGDVTLNLKDILPDGVPRKDFSPKKWGKVWI